jgi:hypothetical protein
MDQCCPPREKQKINVHCINFNDVHCFLYDGRNVVYLLFYNTRSSSSLFCTLSAVNKIEVIIIWTMPRTRGSKNKSNKDDRDPLEVYKNLELHKQLVCWNYFRFLETNGAEGWNPADAGSVFHQRSSQYLLSLGTKFLLNLLVVLL